MLASDATHTATQAVTLSVTDVNEAPSNVALSASTVAENTSTASAVTIGSLSSTDPDTGNTFTYSLVGGADQASFQITGADLQFKAGTTLDYETKSSYAVTVRSTDQGGLTYDKALTISLSNVNEKPAITASDSQNVTQAVATAITGISIADPDAGSNMIIVSLSAPAGSFTATSSGGVTALGSGTSSMMLLGAQTNINSFISAGSVTYTTAINATGTVTLSIGSNDGGSSGSGGTQTDSTTETLNIVLPNGAPVFTSGATGSVAENAATSTVVYTAVATDPENDTLTYTLSGTDAAAFSINGSSGAVTLVNPADYETKASYSINVLAKDPTNTATTKAVTLSVTDVNEAPTNVALSASTVAENTSTASALTIGSLSSTDPDTGNTFTYSLVGGADQASFQVTGANLQFKAGTTLDYETKSSYAVTVRSTDQGGLTYDKALTVSLSDVNEKPAITASASQNVTQAVATAITGISIADPDAGSNPITLILSAAAGILSASNGSGVTVANSGTNSITLTGTQASLNTFISANSVTYTSAAGATGAVTLNISSDDGGSSGSGGTQTDSKTETLNIVLPAVPAAPNTPPVLTSGTTGSVAENAAISTIVYTAAASDVDLGQILSYSLSGTDAASFDINASNGSVTLKAAADYETRNSYSFNIVAADNGPGALTATQAVSVSVIDVNEAPSAIALQNTTTQLPENTSTANPIKVAQISITDDAMGTNTVTLSGADAGNFELAGSALFLKAGTLLDFEAHANYLLNIQANDNALQGSSPATTTFTLNLTNVVEADQKPAGTLPPALPSAPTWNTLSDKDGDGSPELLEDYVVALNVTGSMAGDGNGDGMLDSLQDSVTSISFLKTVTAESAPGNASATFITLVADALAGRPDTTDANTAQLRNVHQKDAAANLPTDMKMPLGLIQFEALVSQKGQSETFSLYLDSEFSANGYWMKNAMGTWVNVASAPYGGQMVNEGGKLRLDFQITDGGEFDADGQINGVITDVGAIASMPVSLAGQAPVTSGMGFWL